MNLAYVSLGALVVAILVSCFTELNVGILAIALAWIVGVYVGGMPLNDVIAGFPVSLFLTLAGVTLLFAQAQQNRTLDRIAHRAVRVCRGNTGLIPIMFFVLGCALASMGPGNISTAALLGPDGDGGGGTRGDSRVSDDHHGRQRRAGRRALPLRADRRHRQRADGEDRPAGPRVVYLLDESCRTRGGRLRRLRAVRRPQAVHVERRGHHRAQGGRHRVRYEQPDHDGGDRRAADWRAVFPASTSAWARLRAR